MVSITAFNGAYATYSFKNDQTYEIEVGFVKLFNGNTVYTFLKVNGKLLTWALVEAYGKTAGNIVIQSSSEKNAFVLS